MRHFRKKTEGHTVIMGRKTYDSIGRPLPKRRNIVITRDHQLQIDGCDVVASLEEALRSAKDRGETEAFIIGGGQVYAQALPHADRVYLTRVHASPAGDVSFPDFPTDEWSEVACERHEADGENAFSLTFLVYERRR